MGEPQNSAQPLPKKRLRKKMLACLHLIYIIYRQFSGRLAQLVRASVLHTGCHRFESCIAHWRRIRTRLPRRRRFSFFQFSQEVLGAFGGKRAAGLQSAALVDFQDFHGRRARCGGFSAPSGSHRARRPSGISARR